MILLVRHSAKRIDLHVMSGGDQCPRQPMKVRLHPSSPDKNSGQSNSHESTKDWRGPEGKQRPSKNRNGGHDNFHVWPRRINSRASVWTMFSTPPMAG